MEVFENGSWKLIEMLLEVTVSWIILPHLAFKDFCSDDYPVNPYLFIYLFIYLFTYLLIFFFDTYAKPWHDAQVIARARAITRANQGKGVLDGQSPP